jgi:DNA-binding NarL/FixJ family response regulator
MIRVALVDDQELVRNGLRMILEGEPDFQVVGEEADGAAAVELASRTQPDVLLMDVQMPGKNGLVAVREIVELGGRTRVLMLTTFDLDEYVYEAMRAGAAGFLLKDMSGEEIVSAVRQAARGSDALLAPAVTRRLIERFASSPGAIRAKPAALDELTSREVEVLQLVARGLSNSEIAERLSIAETTVKTHVARVLMKLDLRDRIQAVIFAYENGLIGGRAKANT